MVKVTVCSSSKKWQGAPFQKRFQKRFRLIFLQRSLEQKLKMRKNTTSSYYKSNKFTIYQVNNITQLQFNSLFTKTSNFDLLIALKRYKRGAWVKNGTQR